MPRVEVQVIAMSGNQYVLYGGAFPGGELRDGEHPADAARRIVEEATGTREPKLEVVDFLAAPGTLTLVFRALLTDAPKGQPELRGRMELPERVGALAGAYVEDALKTSLAYKLTRR